MNAQLFKGEPLVYSSRGNARCKWLIVVPPGLADQMKTNIYEFCLSKGQIKANNQDGAKPSLIRILKVFIILIKIFIYYFLLLFLILLINK